jgi:hypothetical protein
MTVRVLEWTPGCLQCRTVRSMPHGGGLTNEARSGLREFGALARECSLDLLDKFNRGASWLRFHSSGASRVGRLQAQ